jgi:hypothetical protein
MMQSYTGMQKLQAEGMENIPYDTEDRATMQMLLQRKANAERNEQDYKRYLKEQEEWHHQMEQQSKLRKEEERQRRA